MQTHTKLNLSAGVLSVTVALVLVVAKLWALGQTGSLAIAATLADSAMDLMMSLGGVVAIAYAAKPADDDHNFGHTSAEDLAALGQSLFILISAGVIAAAAIFRLLDDNVTLPEREAQGMAIMVFSILVTLGLVMWQRHVAARTGNRVVKADSLHYLGDLIPMSARYWRFGPLPSLGWVRSIVSWHWALRHYWPWARSVLAKARGRTDGTDRPTPT